MPTIDLLSRFSHPVDTLTAVRDLGIWIDTGRHAIDNVRIE